MFAKNYEKSESFVNTSGPMYAMRVYFLIDPYIIFIFYLQGIIGPVGEPGEKGSKGEGVRI